MLSDPLRLGAASPVVYSCDPLSELSFLQVRRQKGIKLLFDPLVLCLELSLA